MDAGPTSKGGTCDEHAKECNLHRGIHFSNHTLSIEIRNAHMGAMNINN